MLRPLLVKLVHSIRGQTSPSEPAPGDRSSSRADLTVEFHPGDIALESVRKVLPGQIAQVPELNSQHRNIAVQAVWKCVSEGFDTHTLSMTRHGLRATPEGRLRSSCATVQNCPPYYEERTPRVSRYHSCHLDLLWRGANRHEHHRGLHGRKYSITTGANLNRQRVWPGIDSECLCSSRSVVPGLED
jgi:hypothetical protein